MLKEQDEWVVLGITEAGELFEVPNWPDRVYGMVAAQWKDQQTSYSQYLHPAHIDGIPALIIRSSLEKEAPASYAIVQQFALENNLKIRSGRGEFTGKHPAYPNERREYTRG